MKTLTDKQIIEAAYEVDATRVHELGGESLTIFTEPTLFAFARAIAALSAPIEKGTSEQLSPDEVQALADLSVPQLRAMLSASFEQPIASIYLQADGRHDVMWHGKPISGWISLFAHPAPTQLTDERILELSSGTAGIAADAASEGKLIEFARALLAEPQPITAEPKTPLGLPESTPAGTEAIRATVSPDLEAVFEKAYADNNDEIEIMPNGEVRNTGESTDDDRGGRKPLTFRDSLGGEYGVQLEIKLRNQIAELQSHIDILTGDMEEQCTCTRCGNTWISSKAVPASNQPPIAPVDGESESCEICPNCQGMGNVQVLSDNGPDAYWIPVSCPHCNGSGDIHDAYKGACELLAVEKKKYLDACGKIWALKHVPAPTALLSPAPQPPLPNTDIQLDQPDAGLEAGK
jgi:hypothetical protein